MKVGYIERVLYDNFSTGVEILAETTDGLFVVRDNCYSQSSTFSIHHDIGSIRLVKKEVERETKEYEIISETKDGRYLVRDCIIGDLELRNKDEIVGIHEVLE